MLRREFLHHSTLSLTGLFVTQAAFAHSPGPAPGKTTPALALLCPAEYSDHPAKRGAVRLLEESQVTFDLLEQADGLNKYAILLLPDMVRLTAPEAAQLEAYLDQGGAVLASHQSGLTPDGSAFASHRFGLHLVGHAPYSPDFIALPKADLACHLPDTEYLMYLRGMEVRAKGASVLAWAQSPYSFAGDSVVHHAYPGITRCKRVVYFMHPVFTQYAHTTPRWCRQMVTNTLNHLHADLNARAAVS